MSMKYGNDIGGLEYCTVCGDRASGRHYGAISCEGCKGFFKRSIRKKLGYQCRGSMNCEVTKSHRNRCQYCRLQKCLSSGMRSDSVQHERKPILEKKNEARGSQDRLRREEAAYSKLLERINSPDNCSGGFGVVSPGPVLNIALAAVLNKTCPVAPYLAAGNEVDEGRRNQLLLQTQFALFPNIGQFGQNVNKLLQAYAAPVEPPPPIQRPVELPPPEAEEPSIFISAESVQLPLAVPIHVSGGPLRLHAACEAAVRLLGSCARWLRSLRPVADLAFELQTSLFRKCWAELLVLALARWSGALNLLPLLVLMSHSLHVEIRERKGIITPACPTNLEQQNADITEDTTETQFREVIALGDYSDERLTEVLDSLVRFQQYIITIEQLRLSEREHAHLRALCLFSPDGAPGSIIPKLQEHQNKVLRSLRITCDCNEQRVDTLLLQLPVLRTFTGAFLEDVFFVGFVGDVNIDEVIPYLLKTEF